MDLSAVGNAAQAPKKQTGLAGDDVTTGDFTGTITENGGVVINLRMQTVKKDSGKDYPGYCPDKVYAFDTMQDGLAFLATVQKGQPAPTGGRDEDHAPAASAPQRDPYPRPAPTPNY